MVQDWDMSDQLALKSVSPNEGILDSLEKTDESFKWVIEMTS